MITLFLTSNKKIIYFIKKIYDTFKQRNQVK